MHESAPRVSIGLPVFNGERFLGEALDCWLAQTYGDFELIISDNGSQDGTSDICRAYAARDKRIQYFRHNENRGAAWNYNHAYELSRGEYFKWAADDDLCAPDYLEQCVEVLDAQPDVAWCHSRAVHIDPRGRRMAGPEFGRMITYAAAAETADPVRDAQTRESVRPHVRLRAVLLPDKSCMDIFGLIRANLIRQTSMHLPYYGADKVLVAEFALRGRYYEIPEVLFFARVHPGGSGALATATEQQAWIAPETKSFAPARLRILLEHFRAVARAELRTVERTRCYLVLIRYICQFGKWGSLVSQAFHRRGTGGGYLEAISSLEENVAM